MNLAKPYDAFEHLRRALFWKPEQAVAMLTFYADASFGESPPIVAQDEYLVVAGYVGLSAQWERFSPDWGLTLARAGFASGFHASDFFNGVGEYSGWNLRDRERERTALLSELSMLIAHFTLQAFACIIHLPSWDELNQSYMLAERYLSPYGLCGRTVAKFIRTWCADTGRDPSTVEYIFDQGDADWGDLVNRLKADLNIEAIPGNRQKLRPLQAADWIAYEIFREAAQSEKQVRVRPVRQSLISLMYVPSEPQIYRAQDLERLCLDADAHIPIRNARDL